MMASAVHAAAILLNGASSSGKSSVASALQRLLDPPFVILDIDAFVDTVPPDYKSPGRRAADGIEQHLETTGDHPSLVTRLGPVGEQLLRGFHRSVGAYVGAGVGVIATHIVLAPAWFDEIVLALGGQRPLTVRVECPLAVLEAREALRLDRDAGMARGTIGAVQVPLAYDCTVDTARATPLECARHIHTTWTAFAKNVVSS